MSNIFPRISPIISGRLAGLTKPARIVFFVVIGLLVGGVLFWILNLVFYHYLARSYAAGLSEAFDLNRGTTNAVVWASFTAIVVFSGLVFSLSKRRRFAGWAGFLILLIGHGLLIGRVDPNFKQDGLAQKCYVMTRTNIKTLNMLGIDPVTGKECHPLTPQIVEKLHLYREGNRPTKITDVDPVFFDPISGEPVVWYTKDTQGNIELFDLMGFHPKTGEELLPIDKKIVKLWNSQNDKIVRRVPAQINPNKFGFFDSVSGGAKVWYWRSQNGEYEFYDGAGFHPRTGEPFKIITREVIADWKRALDMIEQKKKQEQAQHDKEMRQSLAQAAKEISERTTAMDSQRKLNSAVRCKVMDPTGTPLNLRVSPNGHVVGALQNGTIIGVAESATDSKGRVWAGVVDFLTGEHLGWVYREFISCH